MGPLRIDPRLEISRISQPSILIAGIDKLYHCTVMRVPTRCQILGVIEELALCLSKGAGGLSARYSNPE